jgi:hypothetical protein
MGLQICWFAAGKLCGTPEADIRFVVSQGKVRVGNVDWSAKMEELAEKEVSE